MSSLCQVCFIFILITLTRKFVVSLELNGQDSFDNIPQVEHTRAKRSIDLYDIKTTLTNGINDMEQRFQDINNKLTDKMPLLEKRLEEFQNSLMAEMTRNKEEIKQEVKATIQNSNNLKQTLRVTTDNISISNALLKTEVKNEVQNVENNLKSYIKDLNNRTIDNFLQISAKIENANSLQDNFRTTIKNDITSTNILFKTYVESSIKNEIQTMENNLKSFMTGLQKQIDTSVQSSRSNFGRSVSLLETFKSREDQDGGCGGIIVGDKGYISYHPDPAKEAGAASYRCIWTVRANLYEKVAFKLMDGLPINETWTLSLMPLETMLEASTYNELRDSSKTISSNNEYVIQGPTVFVTLIANRSSSFPNSFRLYYEGKGNSKASKHYRHYHLTEPQGEVDYPKIRNATNYSPHEVTTFVVAPPHSYNLKLHYFDLEPQTNCTYDALTVFVPKFTFYVRNFYSDIANSNRYCARNTTLANPNHGDGKLKLNAFIVTFKSDSSNEHSGFRFSWP